MADQERDLTPQEQAEAQAEAYIAQKVDARLEAILGPRLQQERLNIVRDLGLAGKPITGQRMAEMNQAPDGVFGDGASGGFPSYLETPPAPPAENTVQPVNNTINPAMGLAQLAQIIPSLAQAATQIMGVFKDYKQTFNPQPNPYNIGLWLKENHPEIASVLAPDVFGNQGPIMMTKFFTMGYQEGYRTCREQYKAGGIAWVPPTIPPPPPIPQVATTISSGDTTAPGSYTANNSTENLKNGGADLFPTLTDSEILSRTRTLLLEAKRRGLVQNA